jgi:hypothetical protein
MVALADSASDNHGDYGGLRRLPQPQLPQSPLIWQGKRKTLNYILSFSIGDKLVET